ncbi:MerR family transcriptional regulator [Herbaspirillum sp. alder98]|uniref:MerR family transcriptional regulator n=1 Tax=Herbaspirillum sp. alder98 TaxID=2913096 RepID=UPI001CD86D27|nr:MerR family transcriptional regulator [Herbaspirillum sp. alder98]MCA1326361.1 MerR family transcriptional regulator [Herbaspirillum sp. alder98]
MKIGELARQTGLATSAIRFYEEQGLIASPARGANGYRSYDERALKQLRIVVAVQKLGFSLENIRRMFSDDGVCSKTRTIEQIEVRLSELQELELALASQRRDIESLKKALEESIESGQDPMCPTLVAASPRRTRKLAS